MTSIVINKCYGGFSLSHAAIMKYAQKKKIKLYPYINSRNKKGTLNFNKFIPYNNQNNEFVFYTTKPIKNDKELNAHYFCPLKISRDDPLLIAIIKELGTKANGPHALLKIIQIPDNIKWEIDDYDGFESIEEVHRTWN